MLSKEEDLARNLRSIMPNATSIVDYKENGDGDAVLLCHNYLRIVERGVSGRGFAAWAKVNTNIGIVGVLCLHAPNESRNRKEVWAWMRTLISTGQWIILGDFNMVESQIDSIGPSPVIRGEEKNTWDLLTGSADLVDARVCATTAKGPLFTRQAWYGNRFDQSRLDRFYMSGGGEWLYHIRSVEHQGARTLSDHVHIVLEVVTKELVAGSRPRRSYFKMDFKAFKKEGVLDRAKEAWVAHPRWARDKRKRWALALGRIRKLLMEVRNDANRGRVDISLLEEKVEEARGRVQHDQSEEARSLFEEAVTTLRRREQEEAEQWARLNLQKSIVMQLSPRQPPDWLNQTGCEVAEPGKSFKYLGVATSSPVNERTISTEIVQKLMRKLKHWSNRLLSWPTKTILLKHVLAATPLYQLMSVGLSRDGLEELENLCRNFLWGWNEEGNPKHALIAWERIAQTKAQGGLGWVDLKVMADALYVRQVHRILEGGQAEWIQLARSFILRTLRKGAYQRECSQWSLQETLLLLPLTKVEGSPTLSRMLRSWYKARQKLKRTQEGGELGARMTMFQVKVMHQLSTGEVMRALCAYVMLAVADEAPESKRTGEEVGGKCQPPPGEALRAKTSFGSQV
ncbi:hypothetical protein R1sor_023419 [Riccia sorocarpa]|uniref:Endonuclease/exonuclease/phosphatase domain-containing protein n=1 Tax=Riccia sorocarpa TaxID=122646 RepID=A0ABD3GMK5_9MARC